MNNKTVISTFIIITGLILLTGFNYNFSKDSFSLINITRAELIDWSKVKGSGKQKPAYSFTKEQLQQGVEDEQKRWEETKRQEKKEEFQELFLKIGLFIWLLLGGIVIISLVFRKNSKNDILIETKIKNKLLKNMKKYLGEILIVIGSGIFIYNVLDISSKRYYYYKDDTLLMISIGIMLIVSGVFIFINKRKTNKID